MKYELKNGNILKNGHTMFMGDVLRDLGRKEFLEKEYKQLSKGTNDKDEWKSKLTNLLEGLEVRKIDKLMDKCTVENYKEFGKGYVLNAKKLLNPKKELCVSPFHTMNVRLHGECLECGSDLIK